MCEASDAEGNDSERSGSCGATCLGELAGELIGEEEGDKAVVSHDPNACRNSFDAPVVSVDARVAGIIVEQDTVGAAKYSKVLKFRCNQAHLSIVCIDRCIKIIKKKTARTTHARHAHDTRTTRAHGTRTTRAHGTRARHAPLKPTNVWVASSMMCTCIHEVVRGD